MKKYILLILAIVNMVWMDTQGQTYGFVNIFRDDFSGGALNNAYYHHDITSLTYTDYACIDSNNYDVSGGMVHLYARYTPNQRCPKRWDQNFNVYKDYSFNNLSTYRKYKYGRFTIRALVQKNSGLFPAFWLFGASNNPYYSATEIDIFEIWTQDEDAKSQEWFWKPDKSRDDGSYTWWNWTPNVWAIYTLEWTPTYMRVLLNGNVVSNLSPNEDLFGSLEVILGNQISSGGGIGSPYTGLSNYMDIDYLSIDYPINVNEIVNVNQYSSAGSEHTAFAGKEVNMSPNNGSVIVKASPYPWSILPPGSTLDVMATNKISLKPGFHAEETSNFRARIVTQSEIMSTTVSKIEIADNVSSTGIYDNSDVSDQNKMEKSDNSTGNVQPENLVTIYPNPTNGILNIELNAESASLEIFSSNGAKVFKQDLLNGYTQVDIQNLTNGVYFGKIISKDGLKTFRIIKE